MEKGRKEKVSEQLGSNTRLGIILDQKIMLVLGCENVAGKLRLSWYMTAGTNVTKPIKRIIFWPSI